MNFIQVIFGILLFSSSFIVAQSVTHYDGEVRVDAETGYLGARFDITVMPASPDDSIIFFIYKTTEIISLSSGDREVSYTVGPASPYREDKSIAIASKFIVDSTLTIVYSNNLNKIEDSNFSYNPNWIELNRYTAWFPLNSNYGLFSFHLKVNSDPRPIGPGEITGETNKWVVDQPWAYFDIPIIISDSAKMLRTNNSFVNVYYLTLNDTLMDFMQTTPDRYFEDFTQSFGSANTGELSIAVNRFDRTLAYARKGFISMSLDSGFFSRNEQILAHEIAHLWWNKADIVTWEDWLNEAFAQYSFLMIYRKEHSEAEFKTRVEQLAARVDSLPPIRGIDKSNAQSNVVLTYKGAYLLILLEDKIGNDALMKLLRETHHRKIENTEEFLSLIAEQTDIETANWFEIELDK